MAKNTLKNHAYQTIKEDIIQCVYPPGSFLIESELMASVGASRTPIREALNKLEQEDFVRILPKRGVMVNEITIFHLDSVYQMRFMAEPYLVFKFGHRIPKEELMCARKNILEMCHEEKQQNLLYSVNQELHQMVIHASKNPYLHTMMSQIYAHNNRIHIFCGIRNQDRCQEREKEHLKILDFLLAENYYEAAKAMRFHLKQSHQSALEALISLNHQKHMKPLLYSHS